MRHAHITAYVENKWINPFATVFSLGHRKERKFDEQYTSDTYFTLYVQ